MGFHVILGEGKSELKPLALEVRAWRSSLWISGLGCKAVPPLALTGYNATGTTRAAAGFVPFQVLEAREVYRRAPM